MALTPPRSTSAALTSAGYGRSANPSNVFLLSSVLCSRSNGAARSAASIASRCSLLMTAVLLGDQDGLAAGQPPGRGLVVDGGQVGQQPPLADVDRQLAGVPVGGQLAELGGVPA